MKSTKVALQRSPRAAVAIVAAMAMVLSACSSDTDSSGTGATSDADQGAADSSKQDSSTDGDETDANGASGTYRIPLPTPEGDVEPMTASSYGHMLLTGLVTDGLLSQDVSGNYVPHLAESWEESDDGLQWVITMREGAVFNDGTPVTADDVVATFTTLMAPDSVSPGKSSFEGVLDNVSADDESTVTFQLQRPFAEFPRLLTGSNTAIMPADYVPSTGSWLDDPVGAGQFLLDDFDPSSGATFSKNPQYWDADNIDIAGVEVIFFSDSQAQTIAFQTGEIDQINSTPEVKAVIDTSKYRLQELGYSQFNGFFFNTEAAPFDDVKVREAVAWALDRDAIVSKASGGDAVVHNDSVFMPNFPIDIDPKYQRSQDADRVQELLGDSTVSFTITAPGNVSLLAQVIQSQLNEFPQFDVQIDVMPEGKYYDGGADAPWLTAPATITTWALGRLPSQFVKLLFGADSDMNASHYTNSELTDLAEEFSKTSDEADRVRIADRITEILYQDVPVVIPEVMLYRQYVQPRVQGDFTGALDYYGGFDFRGISLSD